MQLHIPLSLNYDVCVPNTGGTARIWAYFSKIPKKFIVILVCISALLLWTFLSPFDSTILRISIPKLSQHSKEDFIQKFLAVEVGGQLNPQPIQELCAGKEWNPDILLTCDHVIGGIGNVRNHILNCLRYAIEFGGSLVIPTITMRNPDDIANINTHSQADLSYLFDKEHFISSLHTACPQMALYNQISDYPKHAVLQHKIPIVPRSLQDTLPPTGWTHPEEWHDKFHAWLDNKTTISASAPALVGLGRAYLEYPIHSDSPLFASNFGKILRFREDVRHLAATTLYSLSQTFDLAMNAERGIQENAYFGAHLRTEADAVKAFDVRFNNSRYEVQSKLFLEQAKGAELPVLYLASGNQTEIQRFKTDALNEYGISVTTKSELLAGVDLETLEALAWDQRGLVDFLVLLKASQFAGIGHSSFAWNIALVRHLESQVEGYLEGDQLLSDEFSRIYGVPLSTPQYASCMWP